MSEDQSVVLFVNYCDSQSASASVSRRINRTIIKKESAGVGKVMDGSLRLQVMMMMSFIIIIMCVSVCAGQGGQEDQEG